MCMCNTMCVCNTTVCGVSPGYSARMKCAVHRALSTLFVDAHLIQKYNRKNTHTYIHIYHGFPLNTTYRRSLALNNSTKITNHLYSTLLPILFNSSLSAKSLCRYSVMRLFICSWDIVDCKLVLTRHLVWSLHFPDPVLPN